MPTLWLKSIKELCLAVSEFVTITKQNILEGLKMEEIPWIAAGSPSTTIFSWVLGPPTEATRDNTGCHHWIPHQNVDAQTCSAELMPIFHGLQPGCLSAPQELPQWSTFPSTRAWQWCNLLPTPEVLPDIATCMRMLEPARLGWGTSTDVAAVGRMTPRISSMSTSRIVWTIPLGPYTSTP